MVEIADVRFGITVEPGPGCAWLLVAQARLAGLELADEVTPEMVLDLECPTRKFLCPLTANSFGIDFLSITTKHHNTGLRHEESYFRGYPRPAAADERD